MIEGSIRVFLIGCSGGLYHLEEQHVLPMPGKFQCCCWHMVQQACSSSRSSNHKLTSPHLQGSGDPFEMFNNLFGGAASSRSGGSQKTFRMNVGGGGGGLEDIMGAFAGGEHPVPSRPGWAFEGSCCCAVGALTRHWRRQLGLAGHGGRPHRWWALNQVLLPVLERRVLAGKDLQHSR